MNKDSYFGFDYSAVVVGSAKTLRDAALRIWRCHVARRRNIGIYCPNDFFFMTQKEKKWSIEFELLKS